MAAFYGFAFWQDGSLARQTGDSAKAYEQQKQGFASYAELSPEKRDAQLDQDLKSIEAAIAFAAVAAARAGNRPLWRAAGYSEYFAPLRGSLYGSGSRAYRSRKAADS